MDESEDNILSTDDVKIMDISSIKNKPKKRSLVERELETNLTARITSPVTNGDTSCTSRYGRARRRKTDSDFTDLDNTHTQWKSPPCEKTPVKLPSPAVHKIQALHSPIKTEPKEKPKKAISTDSSLDNQIENIYHENISLSRFGSEEKPNKNSPGPKFPKVYVRTDLIQKREKEGTVALIENMFSPVRSPYKTANSHLSNVLERSAEKYNLNTSSKSHNGHSTASVVKTLDFDSSKKRKKENREGKTLSKSDLFDVEAKCQYQVGDLAWARMGTYPFWPSIVTREPDSGLFVKRKLFGRIERDLIHVTFFGDNGRRSWILETMLRKFLGQLEFQSAKEWFSPSAKKKDPRLYAAFFISEKKLPQWNVSVEEAEALLREPKRLRIDLLNDMLAKPRFNKSTPKSQKSNKIIRTASDVSLSESLYDTLFSEDDGKVEDPEGSRSKLRTSLDVSEVVTACLDNMAAKTGITKIQRQSHMDRWLQKAKSKTPEKLQTKATPPLKEKEVKVISSKKKKKFSPALNLKQKPYSFRRHVHESHNLRSHHNEHDYSSQLNDSAHNDSAVMAGYGIGFITKVESLYGKESVENEELKLKTEDIDATDSETSKNIDNDNTHASENIGLGPINSADDTIDEIQVNMCTIEENAELENTLDTEKLFEVVDPSNMVPAASLEKATVVLDTDLVLTKVIEDSAQKVSKVMQSDSEEAETMSTSKYQLRSAKVNSEKETKDETVAPSNMAPAASLEKATVVPDTDLVLTKVIEDSGLKVSKVMQSDSEKAETMSTSKYQLRSAKVDSEKESKDESLDPSNMVPAANLEKATVMPDTDLVLTKVIGDSGQKVSKVMQSDSEKAETMSTSKYQLRSAKVDSEKEIKDESLDPSNMVPRASLEKATVVPDTDLVLTKVIEDSGQKVSKAMQSDSDKAETMSTSKYQLRSAKVDSEKEIKEERGPMSRQIGCEISDSEKRMSGAKNYLEKVPDTHFENKIEIPKVNLNEIIQLMQVDCKKQSESSLNVPKKAAENYLEKQITNAAVKFTEPKETSSGKHVINTKDAQENKIEIKCNQEEDKIMNVDIKEDPVISMEIVRKVQEDNSPVNAEVQSGTILADSKKHAKSLKSVQNNYEMKQQTGFVDHASDSKEKEKKRSSLRNAKKMNHLENNKSTDLEKDIRITIVRLKNKININGSEQENSRAKIAKEKSSVGISNINLDAQINVTPVQAQAQYEPVKVSTSSDFDVKNQGGTVHNDYDKSVIDYKSKLKKTEKNKNTDLAKYTDSRKASLEKFVEENNFDKKDVNVYESVHVDVEKQKDTVRKSDKKGKEKKTKSRKPKKNKLNKIKIKIVSPRDKPIQPTQLASVKEPATTHQIESIESKITEKKGTLVQPNQSVMEIILLGSEQKLIDTKVIPQHSTMLNVSGKRVIDNKSELKKTEINKSTDLAKNTDSRKVSLEKFVEGNNFDKQDANFLERVHVDVEKRKDPLRKSERKEKEKKTESSKPKKNKLNEIKIKIVSPRDKPTQPTQLASVKKPATTHQIESIESKVTEKKGTLVQPNQNGMETIPLASEQKPIDNKVMPIEEIEYGHLDFIFSISPEKNTCNELENAVAVKPVLQNESLVSINKSKVSADTKNSLPDNNCKVNSTVSQVNKRELRVSVEKMCFSNYSDCKIVNGPIESFAKFKKTDTSNTSKGNDTSAIGLDDDLDGKLELNDSFEEKTDSVESVTLQTPKTVCDSIITSNRPIEDSAPNGELETDGISTACLNMNNKQDCAVTTIEPLQTNECAKVTNFKENEIREHTIVSSVCETVTLEPVENVIKCDVLDSAEENNKNSTSVDANTFIEAVNRLPEPVKVNGFHVDECLDFSDGEFNAETSSINSEDSEPLSITRIKLLSKNRGKVQKALGDPEFVKYMELRQDALMDEHPELSQDEIVEYLFKTWDYEQNTKSDVAKNDDIEQSGLVKGLDNLRQKTIRNSFKRRNKKRDEDTASINSDVSDTSPKKRLRTRVKSPAVPFKEDEVCLSEDHILKIKKELDDGISVNSEFSDDINKNLQSNDSKKLEGGLVSEINDASITSPKQKHNDCDKTSPKKGKTEEKRLKRNYVKEKSKSPKSSNDSSIKKYFKDLHQPTKPAKSIVDVKIELDSQKEIKQECDLDTISLNSEVSLTDLPLSKRKDRKYGEKQNNKTMTDPEFLKYVELRQDNLIDENPQLTHEEIVTYLYKTWLYEENAKSAIKKSDDIEQANLVKGLNQDAAPPKKVRKRIKAEKDSDCEDDIPIAKDKPKRKICPAYYNENISDLDDIEDIEDAIELFEIFKPKKKLNLLSPKSEDTKPEVKTELAPQDKDTAPEVDPDVIDLDEYNEADLYFSQLCEPKPNVFKGLVRERVCEICEKTGNLIKCKGCHCMFHEGCAKKAAEVVEPPAPATRGRKKKKKPGRKPKNLEDSESHSDEKSHDASLELNVSADDDLQPQTVNEDEFEALVSNKMKELIPDEVNYDSYSSEECLYWNTSAPGKCEIIDITIKPKIDTDYANFKCSSCEKFSIPVCFVCKEPVSKNGVDVRQKCQTAHCHKYYHLECLDHWPQTQFNGGEPSKSNKKINEHFETLMCPRHVCHTCVSDDPRGCKTRFSGDKLARCVKCPATYHSFSKCLPAGTQILTGSLIVCPRHYENRPGKVPCHVNTGWCFICALGGSLICCEYCPTSFHAECLNISPPEGGYMCEDCETGRLPLYGEMVWVKLGHYRWWPGLILHPSEIPANIMAVKHSPGEFVVRFFGQYDHYWVNRGRVFPFQEGDSGRVSGQKSKIDAAFTTAMEHAQRACEVLKTAEPNEEESLDIASSLLPPRYVKLKVNKPCGSLCGRKIDIEESSLTQCECNPDEENPCGPYSHCLNRMLLTECGPICRAAERCSNRQFEKRLYPKMTPYRTPHRGWGLKTLEDIKAGQFVIEYVGELIDEEEFRRRMNRMHEIRDENFYFLTLDKERMIDAGPKGNLARFMNHCCEPNCETQKWTVLGDVRVGLFAIYDIPANSELTFNYNLECAGIEKKRCMCGARRCSGYIGAKPKQDEPQVKKNKRTYKKRKNIDQSPSTSINKPKRPVGRPAKPRELTEIEKDLLIIKNATNGISSDSESSCRLSSIDSEKHPKALKRKRVSFSTEDSKRVKVDDLTDVKTTEVENSEMSGMVTT